MPAPDRLSARTVLDMLLQDVHPVDTTAAAPDPLRWPGYHQQQAMARDAAGTDESVTIATGRVADGGEVVAVAWDFGYLGGSMGTVAGARIAAAYDLARERRVPVILLPSTGGARMQEGMAALVQMAATTVATRQHAEAGLLQIALLRHPTTGGVFASHANLADVVWAQPGATIGFAGPRVAQAMTGTPLPEHSHTARGARAAGLVDDVVAPEDAAPRLARLVAWAHAATAEPGTGGVAVDDVVARGGGLLDAAGSVDVDPWVAVERSRDPHRAHARTWLEGVEVAAELHGDRAGADDPALRVALATVHGRPVVVVALDRSGNGGRIGPPGFRKAWRGFELADRLGVPVVTLVDTPGADASAASEAGGIAHHIAATFARLLSVRVPTVTLVTGEGGSGGALALAVSDRLLMQEHATFSVIAPEGAAAILHRDAGRAPEVARLLKPDAWTLQALGIADGIIREDRDPVGDGWAAVVAALDELADQDATDPGARLAQRARRWRTAGQAVAPSSA